ncbi:hypothetical protein [Pseudomonas sp. W03]|uniref:hypothetical protein n=1 Tax=Pseudomonas sp. W03 TaxID=3090666 RepID=UPI003A4E4A96
MPSQSFHVLLTGAEICPVTNQEGRIGKLLPDDKKAAHNPAIRGLKHQLLDELPRVLQGNKVSRPNLVETEVSALLQNQLQGNCRLIDRTFSQPSSAGLGLQAFQTNSRSLHPVNSVCHQESRDYCRDGSNSLHPSWSVAATPGPGPYPPAKRDHQGRQEHPLKHAARAQFDCDFVWKHGHPFAAKLCLIMTMQILWIEKLLVNALRLLAFRKATFDLPKMLPASITHRSVVGQKPEQFVAHQVLLCLIVIQIRNQRRKVLTQLMPEQDAPRIMIIVKCGVQAGEDTPHHLGRRTVLVSREMIALEPIRDGEGCLKRGVIQPASETDVLLTFFELTSLALFPRKPNSNSQSDKATYCLHPCCSNLSGLHGEHETIRSSESDNHTWNGRVLPNPAPYPLTQHPAISISSMAKSLHGTGSNVYGVAS